MRRGTRLTFGAFGLAAFGAAMTAGLASRAIEDRSARSVDLALRTAGLEFATVTTDGLQVMLAGTAASEAERFRAVSVAGREVDPARVVDEIEVADAAEIAAPRFALEVLRDGAEVGLIGLVPETTDRAALAAAIESATGAEVSDLLQTAAFEAPDGWDRALVWTAAALAEMPHAQLSVGPRRISVSAAVSDADEAARLSDALRGSAPHGAFLELDITAPRPVISPFVLRFRMDAEGARFDACSAANAEDADVIRAAARAAGADGADCALGLGTPSPRWAEAARLSIAALAELGAGTLTIADTAVALVAADDTSPERFDDVVGSLEAALPPAFALEAAAPVAADGGPAEFVATRSPEGLVLIRGRLPDDRTREAVEALAAARFGAGSVRLAARTAEGLPRDWGLRVVAGLDALALLETGALRVEPGTLGLRGRTGRPEGQAEIAAHLAGALGEGAAFTVEVAYDEALDPLAALPSPAECMAKIDDLKENRKISFDPGSADLTAGARVTVDRIAQILRGCPPMEIEIEAHSDSQGREAMNLALSQSRADAVAAALIDRGATDQTLVAKGYGEARPIADNKTEAGREANRRIAFTLMGAEPEPLPVAAPEVPSPAAAPSLRPTETEIAAAPRVSLGVSRGLGAPAADPDAEDAATPILVRPEVGIDSRARTAPLPRPRRE